MARTPERRAQRPARDARPDARLARDARHPIAAVLAQHEAEILTEWLASQRSAVRRPDILRDGELNAQAAEFLAALREAVLTGNVRDVHAAAYEGVRSVLGTTLIDSGSVQFIIFGIMVLIVAVLLFITIAK